ncbi:hypothetical protein SAMN05660293_02441 [Dyadobacter psychrophilus]|uniref:Uncharacterized protein n=1 Tax=Dyadobacter psychrophilus TaxID=651661 RepID=A0A1T5EGU6_9BACT|nr:hypothetical protein SAMN05660293_02441 [Dyadobacter psychrophilus]
MAIKPTKNTRVPSLKEQKASLVFNLMGSAKNGPLRNMTDVEIKDMRVKVRYGL